jgi:hypothetical protein
MEDRGEAAEVVRIVLDALHELIRRDIILKGERQEVSPFFVLAEAVGHDDLVDATLVEDVDEGAADEAACACDEHAGFFVEEGIVRIELFLA